MIAKNLCAPFVQTCALGTSSGGFCSVDRGQTYWLWVHTSVCLDSCLQSCSQKLHSFVEVIGLQARECLSSYSTDKILIGWTLLATGLEAAFIPSGSPFLHRMWRRLQQFVRCLDLMTKRDLLPLCPPP